MRPIDELVQAAGGANDVHPGAKGEVIGVAEENFRPHLTQFAGVKGFDAALRSDRHEDGSVNDTVRCGYASQPGLRTWIRLQQFKHARPGLSSSLPKNRFCFRDGD